MESPIRNSKNYDHLFKIILIGDSGVGKTSILARFVGEEVLKSHISTIGKEFNNFLSEAALGRWMLDYFQIMHEPDMI